MILSGHQPCYLPSLGLFAKMAKSDMFMHCGHLQFQRKSWHHRNYILLNGKRKLLSIPVHDSFPMPIRDVWFEDHWKKDHLETIALAYGDAPYFEDYYPTLKVIICDHPHSLEQLNVDLTITIARWLDITTSIRDSAYWHFNGDAIDMIIQMCRAVDADRYLSNEGARLVEHYAGPEMGEPLGKPVRVTGYLSPTEEKRLQDAGIWHQWMTWKDPDNPEPLSAIHHLFLRGPDAAELVR